MGFRIKVRVGKRILYTHSYPSERKAKAARKRTRGARGVVKS